MSWLDYRNVNARAAARMQRWCVDGDMARPSDEARERWADESDDELPDEFKVRRGKRVVCPSCDGHGKHVAASVDAHGLTQRDLDDDPDFADDYFGGRYDVRCETCYGENVVDGELECTHPLWQEWQEFVASLCEDNPWDVAEARYFGC